jgi:hypothetical protein
MTDLRMPVPRVARRAFLRSAVTAVAGAGLLGAAACAKKKAPAPRTIGDLVKARKDAGARADLQVFLAGEDFVAGADSYVPFGLVDLSVGPILDAPAVVHLASPGTAGFASVQSPFQRYTKPDAPPPAPQGINAITYRFETEGIWECAVEVASGGTSYIGTVALQVKPAERASAPLPGKPAIASQTPTTDDNRGVDPICTRTPPCDFHRVTLAKALTVGKPTVLYFGTPRFCQSRTCGPNLEELIAVSQRVGDAATFVHVEILRDDEQETVQRYAQGTPTPDLLAPVFVEWRLLSDPWVFLIDPNGVIVSRYEGPVTAGVIEPALRALTG